MDAAAADNSGRLFGQVTPMAIDTCSLDLIKDSYATRTRTWALVPTSCR